MCDHFKDPIYFSLALYAALEFFLGKTKPFKSGSILEIIFNVLKFVLAARLKRPAIAMVSTPEYAKTLVEIPTQTMEKGMKKSLEIIKEELKAAGVEVAEEVAEKAIAAIFEKALPRIVVEEENAAVKSIAGVIAMAYPAIKPALENATDFNRDGK